MTPTEITIEMDKAKKLGKQFLSAQTNSESVVIASTFRQSRRVGKYTNDLPDNGK